MKWVWLWCGVLLLAVWFGDWSCALIALGVLLFFAGKEPRL